jgi:hypothetical protein
MLLPISFSSRSSLLKLFVPVLHLPWTVLRVRVTSDRYAQLLFRGRMGRNREKGRRLVRLSFR